MKKALPLIMALISYNLSAQVDMNDMYQRANQMLQSGNISQSGLQKMFDNFSKGYNQEVENNKKNCARKWLSSGIEKSNSHIELGAIEDLNISIENYPTSEAYNRRGCSEYALGEYEKALVSFEKAINLNPNEPDYNHNLEAAKTKILQVKSAPISIYDIKVANVDKDNNIISDYGSPIFSGNACFLRPKIYYKSNIKNDVSLKLKFYKPDGSLRIGDSSPSGFSTKDEVSIDGNGIRKLTGWGSNKKGTWPSGNCRIEIWYYDVCLASTNIYILSETSMPNSNTTMPFYQPIQGNSNSNSMKLKRRSCTYCNGTGTDPYPTSATSYGYDNSSKNRCSVCGKYENHYHKRCISCQGKGYIESY
jgi:tetratricopeptide (TPR) repeat protein